MSTTGTIEAPEKPVSTQNKESSTVSDKHLPPLNVVEIMEHIPHRYPFLLVDAVTEHVEGKYIKGYKNVTMNEHYFQGHFPNRPLMPGVLQLEAMAQLGGILISHLPEGKGKLAVFAGIDKVRFRQMVTPGDQLEMHCELVKFRAPIGKSHCYATVNGERVVEADLMFSLVEA